MVWLFSLRTEAMLLDVLQLAGGAIFQCEADISDKLTMGLCSHLFLRCKRRKEISYFRFRIFLAQLLNLVRELGLSNKHEIVTSK